MTTAETIYELVKALPETQANMVLAFTQFLQQQTTDQPQKAIAWSEQVHALAGAWTDFPTAEELRLELGPDTQRELL